MRGLIAAILFGALSSAYADNYGPLPVLIMYESLVQQKAVCDEREPTTARERSIALERLKAKTPEFIAFHQAIYPSLASANNFGKIDSNKVECKRVVEHLNLLSDGLVESWPEIRLELQKLQSFSNKRQ